jgi:hypothetical protein
MSDTLSPAPEQSREQEPWPSVDTSHLANRRVSVLIRRLLMGSAAAVALAGCASGSRVSSLSQPSADPTVYAVTGSPTGPVFPEPVSTTTTIWSPPRFGPSPSHDTCPQVAVGDRVTTADTVPR